MMFCSEVSRLIRVNSVSIVVSWLLMIVWNLLSSGLLVVLVVLVLIMLVFRKRMSRFVMMSVL